MTFIPGTIPNLLGGVSQKPATSRRMNEVAAQDNCRATYQKGLTRRPHTDHVAVLTDDGSLTGSAYVHTIDRRAGERYALVFVDGDLRAFDNETGAEITVSFPDGKSYLASTDPQFDIRCATVGDTTFVVNRSVATTKAAAATASRPYEAIVFVRQADFSTTYTITLNGTDATYTTIDGTSPDLRSDIATENIASKLYDAITGSAVFDVFSVERFGSTLYIKRDDDGDFDIQTRDGLADNGLLVVKGAVQDFTTLPLFCKNGFICEVTGDVGTKYDNYWVVYDDLGKPQKAGVWRETVRPGILLGFDPAKMPHELVLNATSATGISQGPPTIPNIFSGGATDTSNSWADTLEGVEPGTGIFVDSTEDTGGTPSTGTTHRYAKLETLPSSPTTVRVRGTLGNTTNYVGGHPAYGKPQCRVFIAVNNTPGGTVWTDVADSGWRAGLGTWGLDLSFVLTAGNNYDIRMTFSWQNNGPVAAHRYSFCNLFGPTDSPVGISYVETPHKEVVFVSDEVYPKGFDVSLDLSGPSSNTVTLTVSADAYTGADLAADFQIAIDALAHYSSTNPSPGVVTILPDAGVASVVYSDSFDELVNLHDESNTFTPSALIGQTVKNLTDGSEGIITANNNHVITVGALTGGVTNTFNKGDTYSTLAAANTFVFREATWKDREVGDDATNGFPSFTGNAINEVLFYKGRLGFLSGESMILSVDGDVYNFFRLSAKDLFDSDHIDVSNGFGNIALFHSHVLWNNGLYLIADNAQLLVSGSPLTPASAGFDIVGRYENSPRVRPLVMGDSVVFCKEDHNHTRVYQLSFDNSGSLHSAYELTQEVPTYIPGKPLQLVGSNADGFLGVLTDDALNTLFVYDYYDDNEGRKVAAWSQWEWPSGWTIRGVGMTNSKLYFVHEHPVPA